VFGFQAKVNGTLDTKKPAAKAKKPAASKKGR
jgi:hypothetical protein